MASRLAIFIQSPEHERACWPETRASIEASDIGNSYEVLHNPPRVPRQHHLVGVLRTMAKAPTELVLRLEDDILCNRHLLENVAAWPDMRRASVGRLFTFASGTPGLHPGAGSQAIVFRRSLVPAIADVCEAILRRQPLGACYQDRMLYEAMGIVGATVVTHRPSLVDHLWQTPSTILGRPSADWAHASDFRLDWRRAYT